jgi:hypothetical protein
MSAVAFDTLKCARRLKAVGFTQEQAETQAEVMAEAFVSNVETLVTKDYLDARLAVTDGKVRLLFWGQGVIFAAIIIPTLRDLLVI